MFDKIDGTVEERVAWRSYIYIYFNKRVGNCRKYWQMLQSCLWILKTDSLLTNVDNYNLIITTVKSSIFNFSGFVGPSLTNDHHICHFLLFSCFYLIHAIFVNRWSVELVLRTYSYKKLFVWKKSLWNIFCLKEIFDLGSIHKVCSYVIGGKG